MRVVSFSGGRSSGMMLWLLRENGELTEDTTVIFANTGKERPETLDFVNECSQRWDVPIVWVEFRPYKPFYEVVDYCTASRKGEPFESLILKRKCLPNPFQRLCTGDLKVKPIRRYIRSKGHRGDIDTFLGLRYDEKRRVSKKKAQNHRGKDAEFYKMPLHEMGITEKRVLEFWSRQPFDLQIHSALGNCDLCFMKGKENLMWTIRRYPEKVAWWKEMETKVKTHARKKINTKFHKDWSYEDLENLALNQMVLFEEEPPPSMLMECGCTD